MQTLSFLKRFQVVGSVIAIVCLHCIHCNNETLPLPSGHSIPTSKMVVNGLHGAFDPANDAISLQWTPALPSNQLIKYEVHRYTKIDTVEGKILDEFVATIGPNHTSYTDNSLDLHTETYYYFVIPWVKDPTDGSPIIGISADTVGIIGGKGIGFTINDGAGFVIKRECKLQITDPKHLVRKLRFTQERLNDTSNVPLFVNAGYKDVDGNSDEYEFTELLKAGGGRKVVFAEITTTNSIDTLRYDISIAPYRAKIWFHNERIYYDHDNDTGDAATPHTNNSKATMLYYEYQPNKLGSIFLISNICVPNVKFSFSLLNDSTFSQDFEYWLLLPYAENALAISQNEDTSSLSDKDWIETVHRQGSLTGIGKYHDENKGYQYNFDPNTPEGKENLNYLFRIPNTQTYPVAVNRQKIGEGKPYENYHRVRFIRRTLRASKGLKEFVLVLRFTGRFFGEDRYIFSRPTLVHDSLNPQYVSTNKIIDSTHFDFYPPNITFLSTSNSQYINNGDTIYSNFKVTLNQDGAIRDFGHARIKELSLIVTKATQEQANNWNYLDWRPDDELPITMGAMKNAPHYIFPYKFTKEQWTFEAIEWPIVDISRWSSGNYFIGIIAKDEFGNEGFAPVSFTGNQTNPWLVTIMNGKPE